MSGCKPAIRMAIPSNSPRVGVAQQAGLTRTSPFLFSRCSRYHMGDRLQPGD
jgi:hypothetical protein